MTHVAPTALAGLASNLTSLAWWKAAVVRAIRTAILLAIPYIGAAGLFDSIPWLSVGSAAALGFLLSLLTSLAGLTEANGGTVPAWMAMLERVTKTVAQGLVTGIGNAVLFQDVNWSVIVQSALIAGLGSLLLAFLTNLPDAAPASTPAVASTWVPVLPVSAGALHIAGAATVDEIADTPPADL